MKSLKKLNGLLKGKRSSDGFYLTKKAFEQKLLQIKALYVIVWHFWHYISEIYSVYCVVMWFYIAFCISFPEKEV